MTKQDKKANFEGQEIYVGIDVHKKQWKVSVGLGHSRFKAFSQPPNPDVLYNYLHREFPGGDYICAYEAGFCGFWIQERFSQLGIKCLIVNPSDIPTTDKERRQKTDKRDSHKILKSLQANQLESIYIPNQRQQEDRSLLREREALIRDIRAVKNRIKSKLLFFGVEIPEQFWGCCWSNKFVEWLTKCQQQSRMGAAGLAYLIEHLNFLRGLNLSITKQIRQLSRSDTYVYQVQLLTGIPGIGMLTAMKYLTEMGPVNRFATLDKHASFIGLVPNMSNSGDQERIGWMTKRGNAIVKSALIESAWIAKRTDPALSLKYEQLIQRMRPSKAIVIIAKKLLSRIRYVLKNNQPYKKGVDK